MRTSSTKNSLIIGISIVLGASLLSVGVSNAAGSTIKACAKKKGGAMRLIDVSKKCKKSERTLTWGTQGSAGATGAAGSNGYSKVYTRSGGGFSLVPNASMTTVGSLNLPAGKYAVNFSMPVWFDNAGLATTHPRYLACAFVKSETPTSTDYIWPRGGSDVPSRTSFDPASASSFTLGNQQVAGNFTLELSSQTSIYLICGHEENGDDDNTNQRIQGDRPVISALQVNEILLAE